ncbi:hypothetical protein V2I01_23985 [Micromonospora sp. BRA006-A]|nr:hypothetical protein [Micromonospora sp. BRA006-A]
MSWVCWTGPACGWSSPSRPTTRCSPAYTIRPTWTRSGPRRVTRCSPASVSAPRTIRSSTGCTRRSALIAGATTAAAEAVWRGEARRAVSVAGGLHHAMPARAAGFCVYNDPAVAIARLLDLGAQRIAYVDVDVHHGDGVQEVLPRPAGAHDQPARDAARAVPGTGFPDETGGPGAGAPLWRCRCRPGSATPAGGRRSTRSCRRCCAFRPQVLVTQCGADGHRKDPLADLHLSVDGQRATYLSLRALADELCDGRWVATGGGGYALVEVVPRAWTHLLAIATGERSTRPRSPRPAGGTWPRGGARARRAAADDRRRGPVVPAVAAQRRAERGGPGRRGHPQGRLPAARARPARPARLSRRQGRTDR